ncbi:MAG: GH3 auxin-responsive promoter family protein [Candidatus Asgardarchaeum sp.]
MAIISITSKVFKLLQKFRTIKTYEEAIKAQEDVLRGIINENRDTKFGKQHNFKNICNVEDYKENVPLLSYGQLKPYIEEIINGNHRILFNYPLKWWVKSTGTTGASKLYPLSEKRLSIDRRAVKKIFYYLIGENPKILRGKFLLFTASAKLDEINGVPVGYMSGVLATTQNKFIRRFFVPSTDVINMENTELKYELTLRAIRRKKITIAIGVTPFLISLLQRASEKGLLKRIRENIEVIFWSGVSISPYKKWFEENIGSVQYLGSYIGSEGFYGAEIHSEYKDSMLLFVESIFYEFVKLDDINKECPERFTLYDVKKGVPYVMHVTTYSGLYSYNVGDVIEFVSLDPPVIKVKGRAKQVINLATEKVTEDEINAAIVYACKRNNCVLNRYLVIPMVEGGLGVYHIYVSFMRKPNDIGMFINDFDEKLKDLNEVYKLVRASKILLKPKMVVVNNAFFEKIDNYMYNIGKPVGQLKTLHILLESHPYYSLYRDAITFWGSQLIELHRNM